MRRFALPLALFAAAAPGLAMAQSGTTSPRQLGVSAQTPQVCSLGQVTGAGGDGAVNVQALSGSTLRIERFVDPSTLTTRAASTAVSLEASCNYPHSLTISSDNNGLWREQGGAAPNGFATAVPYRASVEWAGAERVFDATAASRAAVDQSVQIGEPHAGTLRLSLQVQRGATNLATNAPLVGGSYSDSLRITLGPQS